MTRLKDATGAPQRAEASQSWEDVYRTQTAAIARLEAERDAAIRERDEAERNISDVEKWRGRAEKAEAEVQALREQLATSQAALREAWKLIARNTQ